MCHVAELLGVLRRHQGAGRVRLRPGVPAAIRDVEDAPQNSIIGGATLWVLRGKDSEKYQGVAEFFDYLSQPEVQFTWHKDTGYVPITTAAYELAPETGLLTREPRHRHRDQAVEPEPADPELQGPALRQLRADPRHHQRGARGGLGRRQVGAEDAWTPRSSAATSCCAGSKPRTE
ncbi:MAG: extracellular solute-binding protein [Rhodovibrio sp.]|nr:extracellular solute-binding protein [Rhodovibrio sp.]